LFCLPAAGVEANVPASDQSEGAELGSSTLSTTLPSTPLRTGKTGSLGINEREIVEAACALIEEGKFNAAGQLIEASGDTSKDWKQVSQLREIVSQWQQMQKSRQLQKEAAYKEQMGELERVKAGKPPVPARLGALEDMRVFTQQWLSDLGSTPRRDGEDVGLDIGG
jgi:hypothetical protein